MNRAVDEIQRLILQLTSGDDGTAEAAVDALARLGQAALPRLADLLGSADSDERWWGVRAVAAFDHPDVVHLLIGAMHDERPAVRQAAMLGLRLHPSAEAVPALARALEDRDRLTAHLASDALAACGEDALETLSRALRSPLSSVRMEAARALAGIDHPRVIPLLFEVVDDSSASVSFWAERGLDRLGVGMVFFRP